MAFLKTLTGRAVYEDPKYSSPFDAAGALSLILLPVDGAQISVTGQGDAIEVVVTTQGVPYVDYVLQCTTDFRDWVDVPARADAEGVIRAVAPNAASNMFFRIAYAASRAGR